MTADTAVGPPSMRDADPAASTPSPSPRRSLLGRCLHSWQLYVLLAPAVVYLIVFKYWPMYGAQIAFQVGS